MALIGYSQLSHLWQLLPATTLKFKAAVSGLFALILLQNVAGVDVLKFTSNGGIEGSGSLLIGSGSTTLYADSITGNVSIGKRTSTAKLDVSGVISGSVLYGLNSLRSSGTLVFEGAASGSSLYLGTSLKGAGLSTCSNGTTDKVLWNSSTGRFSCGVDQSGGSFGSGNVITIGNSRYVSKQGATMTGLLVIQNGNTHTPTATPLINVLGTLSGSLITLSSGTSYTRGSWAVGGTTVKSNVQSEVYGTLSGSTVKGTTLSGNTVRLQYLSPRLVGAIVVASGSTIATGSGKSYLPIPTTASGYNITNAECTVMVSGTTNSTTVQMRNLNKGNRKIFSTPITITSGSTADDGTYVINSANRDVGGKDRLAFDFPSVSTTAPKVMACILTLTKP